MEPLKEYCIEIFNLTSKKVEYLFNIGNEFFRTLEQTLVDKGECQVKITLDKSDTMIKAGFEINGWIELICDRTLNPFNYPIHINKKILYKYGDHDEEITDEIIMIKHDTMNINVAQPIFDFIALDIPLKKIHPDFLTEADKSSDEDILIYSSVSDENNPTDNNIDILDPRWEALKKLKDTF